MKPVEASWSGNLHVNIATLVVLLYIYPPYLSKWVKSSLNLASLSLDCEPLCLFALLSLFLAKNIVTNFILTFCWFLLFIAAHFGSLVKIGYPPFRPFCKKPERIGPERLVFLFAFLSFNWVFLICTSSDEHSIPFSLWMHLCRVGFVTKARNRRRYCHFVEEWYIYETPVKAGCVLYCLWGLEAEIVAAASAVTMISFEEWEWYPVTSREKSYYHVVGTTVSWKHIALGLKASKDLWRVDSGGCPW